VPGHGSPPELESGPTVGSGRSHPLSRLLNGRAIEVADLGESKRFAVDRHAVLPYPWPAGWLQSAFWSGPGDTATQDASSSANSKPFKGDSRENLNKMTVTVVKLLTTPLDSERLLANGNFEAG
jgi:hypothetical protein